MEGTLSIGGGWEQEGLWSRGGGLSGVSRASTQLVHT